MALVRSLRARVILWVSVALTVLFAITIVGLDVTFRQSTERALRELLDVQILGLIAAAEPGADGGLTIPPDAISTQFQVTDSGLYGALFDGNGTPVWQSLSLLGRDFPVHAALRPNERHYEQVRLPGFPPLEAALLGIS